MLGPMTYGVLSGLANGVAYADKVLGYSPLGYWQLNQESGVQVIDSSGNGYHGKAIGVTWSSGAGPGGGYAPVFDGVNDYIDAAIDGGTGTSNGLLAAINANEGTVLAWFKVSSVGVWTDGTFRYMYRVASGGGNVSFRRQTVDNQLRWFWETIGATFTLGGKSDTVYVPVAHSYSVSNNRVRHYYGGALLNSAAFGAGFGSFLSVTIGGDTFYWSGNIVDVALFNTELSQDVIENDLSVR